MCSQSPLALVSRLLATMAWRRMVSGHHTSAGLELLQHFHPNILPVLVPRFTKVRLPVIKPHGKPCSISTVACWPSCSKPSSDARHALATSMACSACWRSMKRRQWVSVAAVPEQHDHCASPSTMASPPSSSWNSGIKRRPGRVGISGEPYWKLSRVKRATGEMGGESTV